METTSDKEKSIVKSILSEHCATPSSHELASTDSNGSHVKPVTFTCLLIECLALGLVVFLVWLDEGILATVIPSISNHFQSFSALAWYAPSYLFGLAVFQLPFGRVYKDFATRPTFLISLSVFELGSIVQAAAPNSGAFIVGRVIAGIGGSGVLTGALTILSQQIPKSKLPFVMGCFSWIHGVCGIAGPIIGGAIASSRLSWRWCFYINPIISIVSTCPILFLWRRRFQARAQSRNKRPSTWTLLKGLDYLGILTIVPCVISFLLALQLGGSIFTWSDPRSIAPLAVAGFLFVIFWLSQLWKGDDAMLPPRIAKLRVVFISAIYSGSLDAAYFVMVYYLPIWFQAIKGVSALDSGYRILPLLIACIVCNFSAAALAGKLGFYHPFMMLGSITLTLGTGLLTTLNPNSSVSKWVVFQILVGVGTGSGGQLPLIAVQDALAKDDVPIGYAVVLSSANLLPTAALAITQAVFGSILTSELKKDVPGVDPDIIKHAGATDWKDAVSGELVNRVLRVYDHALVQSWYVAVALAGTSFVILFGLKWKRLDLEDRVEQDGRQPVEGCQDPPTDLKE